MSNPVMYLIHFQQGPDYELYEDHVGLAASEKEAKNIADECARRYWIKREAIEALSVLIRAESDAFDARDLCPECPKAKNWPRWGNGIKQQEITQAMRDERDRIKAENAEILVQHGLVIDAWKKRKAVVMQAVMDASPELCALAQVQTYAQFQARNHGIYHPSKDDPEARKYYVTAIPVLTMETCVQMGVSRAWDIHEA